MNVPSAAPADAPAALVSDPIPDPTLRRLNPANGLFLRAEHLDQIRIYAEEFALAAGVSAGPGVDHGLDATIDAGVLNVSQGLAVDESRRPLRLATATAIKLNLDPTSARLWIVEIAAVEDPIPAGREPIYGTLCDDPCNGASLAPWGDSAVVITVRPDLRYLGDAPPSQIRSRLASSYFALERSEGKPWLPPSGAKQLRDRPWSVGLPADPPVPGAVPIAALLWDNGKWVVDTWIARRDIGGPPSRAAWEGRLGLRRWNVFIAQVLQFQAQLADVLKGAPGGAAHVTPDESFARHVELLAQGIPKMQAKKNAPHNLVSNVLAAVEQLKSTLQSGTASGIAKAFVELPAAGVIPLPPTADPVDYFGYLFGTSVAVQVEQTRHDCALQALEDAQHLDRIRLEDLGPDDFVRLLVPDVADGVERWMVFVRGCCPSDECGLDAVEVFVDKDDAPEDPHDCPDISGKQVTTLYYPRGGWAVPKPDDPLSPIRDEIGDNDVTQVRAYVTSEDRRSLALVRSALLMVDLPAEPRSIDVCFREGPEAIVIHVAPPPSPNG